MLKKLLILAIVTGMLINLFSAPVSLLIYEVNKQIQAHGTTRYQVISMTVCEASCAIQKRFVVEQHIPAQPRSPLTISFNPLAFFWQPVQSPEMHPDLLLADLRIAPRQIGVPNHVIDLPFVPPRQV